MICPTCNGEMKALFTGFYCPKDCDRRSTSVPDGTEAVPFMWNGERWYAQVVDAGDLGPGSPGICLWEREPAPGSGLVAPSSWTEFRKDPRTFLLKVGCPRSPYPGHKYGVRRSRMESHRPWVDEMGQPIIVRFFKA